MELRHLRYFVAVAEHKSVRLAAERLHITQPAISRQIQDLEEELGVALFERSAKGLTLTPAGESYLHEVRKAFAMLDSAAGSAQRVAHGLQGSLKLGYVENTGWDGIVPQTLYHFQSALPGVKMALSALNTPEQLGHLANEVLDGGFIYRYGPLPGTIEAMPLMDYDVVLAVPRAWGVDHGEPSISLRSMADRPFVLFPRSTYPSYYDLLIGRCMQAGVHLNVVQEETTETAILSLVCAGIGAAIVNSANLGRPPAQVRFFRLRDLSIPMPLTFAYRKDSANPVLSHFLQVLKTVLQGQGKTGAEQ
jgi:DNA-binding transcriptional LysR family regulator